MSKLSKLSKCLDCPQVSSDNADMENWTKLYQQIVTSSIWKLPSDVRIVWIALLALKDENGHVRGTAGWLAEVAKVPLPVCEQALESFRNPDPTSRSPFHDGRRIQDVEDGWIILNHHLYRDGMDVKREKWRLQKQAQRAVSNKPSSATVSHDQPPKAQPEADADRLSVSQSKRTTSPSDEVVCFFAASIGLPNWKALDTVHRLIKAGWKDNKGQAIRNWHGILRYAKVQWEEDGRPEGPESHSPDPYLDQIKKEADRVRIPD